MRTLDRGKSDGLLVTQLEKYSASTKVALKKTPAIGVAAAAFAVGTAESEAAIVVVDVNQAITSDGLSTLLDIEGFGAATDFEFQGDSFASNFVRLGARQGNQIAGSVSAGYNYVNRLSQGAAVGSMAALLPANSSVNNYLAFSSGGAVTGEWGGGNTGFIGISVVSGTDVNYGWIEVSVNADNSTGEIIRYAIETDANVEISAGAVPEPNSLACLAVGAAGLLGWRKRKREA